MLMPKRSYVGAFGYRYGFNGKENDNDVKGLGNQQDFGMRIYDPRLGRFLSVDPLMSAYPSWSPYPFAMNSPIAGVDLDGAEFFYAADGKLLGNKTHDASGKKLDDKTANSVMLSTGVDDKGEYTGVVDLNISHADFQKAANIINHESVTGDKQELLNIAHASVNESKNRKMTVGELLSTGFSSVPSDNKTSLPDTDESDRANFSRSGLIHALSGGGDSTNGATRWDGTDFLAWGIKGPYGAHQKLREMGVEISESILGEYLAANKKYWGTSVRYGKKSYTLPHSVLNDKKNFPNHIMLTVYESVFGLIHERNTFVMGKFGFPALQGQNKGKVTLKATTTAGLSIFWTPTK